MDDYEKPIAAVFAARLKALRTAAGWTMAQLGSSVEPPMSAPAIARYESGERVPTWSAVVRLARVLGVSVAAFEAEVEPGPAETPKGKKGRGASLTGEGTKGKGKK
jgi:transcriptional regulator with XRE-family HTH domain